MSDLLSATELDTDVPATFSAHGELLSEIAGVDAVPWLNVRGMLGNLVTVVRCVLDADGEWRQVDTSSDSAAVIKGVLADARYDPDSGYPMVKVATGNNGRAVSLPYDTKIATNGDDTDGELVLEKYVISSLDEASGTVS